MIAKNYPIDFARASVAIVDDDPTVRLVVRKAIERHNVGRIEEASSVAGGRQLVSSGEFDLFVLDVNMPDGYGVDLIPDIIDHHREIAPGILVLTANHEPEIARTALRRGADDFLTKPVDQELLSARMSRVLALRLSYRALANRREELEREVRARTDQLTRAYQEVTESLGRASSFRDNETWEHVSRMSNLSARIAEELGWEASDVDLLRIAATTHDVGKIGIPDAILFKPATLTPEEREVMETHTIIGAQILEGTESRLVTMSRTVAISHHEKWDGSGYPSGLAGDDIPIVGRITAIADVYDALTNERPYKPAWTPEEAVQLIRDGAGSHFDPDAVKAFLSVVDEAVTQA